VAESVVELRAAILEMIGRGADQPRADDAWNRLALRLFGYQFQANATYRRYCERRGKTPETVKTWGEIPTVPIAAFKEFTLACGAAEQAVACFMTSGTTNPAQRGRHYHFTLDVYDASAATFFKANLLPELDRMRLLILGSPPELSPNSSLAHYLDLMRDRFGSPGSGFYIGKEGCRRSACGGIFALRKRRGRRSASSGELRLRSLPGSLPGRRPTVSAARGQPGDGHRRVQGEISRDSPGRTVRLDCRALRCWAGCLR